jgi:hypothetical protein
MSSNIRANVEGNVVLENPYVTTGIARNFLGLFISVGVRGFGEKLLRFSCNVNTIT